MKRGAPVIDVGQRRQQLFVVGLITGIPGIPCLVNPGGTPQRVDGQPGVIRNSRQAGRGNRVLCLDQ